MALSEAVLQSLSRWSRLRGRRFALLAATLVSSLFYLGSRIDALGARIDGLDTGLNARLDSLDARLNSRLDSLDARLNSRLDGLSARMDATLARPRRLRPTDG